MASLRLKKYPKKPKIGASQRMWATYEKKLAAVVKHNNFVLVEKERRRDLTERYKSKLKVAA